MKVFMIFGLLLMLVTIGFVQPVSSQMMCAGGDEADHFWRSDVTFIGTIIEINPSNDTKRNEYVTFDIKHPIKGLRNQSTITVATYQDGSYSSEFKTDFTYLVHASKGFGFDLFTSMCSGNQSLQTEKDIMELEQKLSQISSIPPLKQKQYGLTSHEIQCKQNLVLLQKYDGTPACVTESTKQKLIERGWTKKKTWEPSPTDGFTPTDMPYFENQNANELKSYRNIKNSIVIPDNTLILSSKELDRTLDDLRQVGLPIVMSAIDYDTGVIAIWTPDVTQEKLFKEHLGDIPFVLLYEEAPPRWETGDPKPEPEPKNEN